MNYGLLDNRAEGFAEINSRPLGESSKDPTCLVVLQ